VDLVRQHSQAVYPLVEIFQLFLVIIVVESFSEDFPEIYPCSLRPWRRRYATEGFVTTSIAGMTVKFSESGASTETSVA